MNYSKIDHPEIWTSFHSGLVGKIRGYLVRLWNSHLIFIRIEWKIYHPAWAATLSNQRSGSNLDPCKQDFQPIIKFLIQCPYL